MFGDYFYNQTLRKMTIAFGQIFNNIQIKRKDSNGNVVQSIRVPLAYAPKEKFLTRLDQQPNLNDMVYQNILYIDTLSLPFVEQVKIDWEQSILGEEFVFINPLETTRCGCGESFHME